MLTICRNTGFLRYWTVSNLPLFLLAAPMLWLLFKSGTTVLLGQSGIPPKREGSADADYTRLPQLALPQLMLAATALTSFHVQIVNRLCSGYPMWYIVLADWLSQGDMAKNRNGQFAVRGMILYAIIQTILYTDFLPPA